MRDGVGCHRNVCLAGFPVLFSNREGGLLKSSLPLQPAAPQTQPQPAAPSPHQRPIARTLPAVAHQLRVDPWTAFGAPFPRRHRSVRFKLAPAACIPGYNTKKKPKTKKCRVTSFSTESRSLPLPALQREGLWGTTLYMCVIEGTVWVG